MIIKIYFIVIVNKCIKSIEIQQCESKSIVAYTIYLHTFKITICVSVLLITIFVLLFMYGSRKGMHVLVNATIRSITQLYVWVQFSTTGCYVY